MCGLVNTNTPQLSVGGIMQSICPCNIGNLWLTNKWGSVNFEYVSMCTKIKIVSESTCSYHKTSHDLGRGFFYGANKLYFESPTLTPCRSSFRRKVYLKHWRFKETTNKVGTYNMFKVRCKTKILNII